KHFEQKLHNLHKKSTGTSGLAPFELLPFVYRQNEIQHYPVTSLPRVDQALILFSIFCQASSRHFFLTQCHFLELTHVLDFFFS
ncbi:MAG: hypothetical protein IKW46_10185, partial [Bacteroidaceae bacterium]|nr:hypothetical protein [Bacteroidaceae bacterium]